MSGIVCTVTPTDEHGVIVAWFRSETAAEQLRPMAAATRNGFEILAHNGSNGVVPADVRTHAEIAHQFLKTGGSRDRLVEMATHRREQTLGGTLIAVEGRPVPVYGPPATDENEQKDGMP